MDREKRLRRPLRAKLTRALNEADVELAEAEPNRDVLEEKLVAMEDTLNKVSQLDEKIMDLMLGANCTDEDQDDEFQAVEEYQDKVRLMKLRINKLLYPVPKLDVPNRPASPTPSESSFATPYSLASSERLTLNAKLPKPELKKFDGNLKGWLGFWASFKKIHDSSLCGSDKFHYLIQSMVPGSEPSKLLNCYPQSDENYPKAVEELKERFGQESLLIQVYVRELLGLAIADNKDKIPMVDMYMQIKAHLSSLESLNLNATDPSTWLFPLVESILSHDAMKAWQRSPLSKKDGKAEKPPKSSLDYLLEFLKDEIRGEQNIQLAKKGFQNPGASEKKPNHGHANRVKAFKEKSEVPTAAGLFSGQSASCVFCDKGHPSSDCFSARKMSLKERQDKVHSKKGCLACLKPGHFAKTCKAYISCIECSQKHHLIMCPDYKKKEPTPKTQTNLVGGRVLPTLLAALVHDGQRKIVRVLCDTGAQHSYIKRETAKELALTPTGTIQYQHTIFGGKSYMETHKKFVIRLERLEPGVKGGVELEVLCQKKICSDIPQLPTGSWTKELKRKKIRLSDIGGGPEPEIDVLIGAEDYGDILTGRNQRLRNGMMAIETSLGWTLLGREKSQVSSSVETLVSMFVASAEVPISKLWDLDTIGIMDPVEHKSKLEMDEETRQHFLNSVSREQGGRYSVKLPWIQDAPQLPDNRNVAVKRLINSSRKLKETGQFQAYDDMFKSWLQEGIIERVIPGTTGGHFIPHRPVFKPESTTTPVRPVFDASCKTKGFPSLNDCLQKGPNLMELIPSILLRFREKKIGVISDIRKAFLMVGVDEQDRNFLKFLWWEDESQKILIEYRHRRVVFGVNSSPFLLAAVLEYHLQHVEPADQEAASKLWKSLYVDNCVTSVDSMDEYEEFREIATRVLADAKMELRCWECGPGYLESPQCSDPDSSHCISPVLGLKWNKARDTLAIDLELPQIPQKITKRNILSAVHKVYDPIGFTAPVLLQPKLILQEVWAQDVTWDEEVQEDTGFRYSNWANELILLKDVEIPRHFNPYSAGNEQLSIHTFCDASKQAYAAVVFIRAESSEGTSVRLLQVKARVAPLNRTKDKDGKKTEKRLTIPRLELLAATIGARLAHSMTQAMDWKDVPRYFWSDSTTVIAWIQRDEMWGTFAGNRVREILKLTDAGNWNHVPGKQNPADLPSRGCTAAQFLGSRWWEGPDWLYGPKSGWPKFNPEDVDEEEVAAEKKKNSPVMAIHSKPLVFKPKFSSYWKNVRVMGWVVRFAQQLLKPVAERNYSRPLSFKEIFNAELQMLKIIQEEAFPNGPEDITHIKVFKEDGLLKVSSKLTYRIDSASFRNPVILPKDHFLVTQLILEVHESLGHAGIQVVVNALREKYWILQSRRAVGKVIHSCVPCRRYATPKMTVEPAPLPVHRVETVEPYQNTGVDLAGPLFLNKKGSKCWIVLYTCAVYRAVHLDLVESLSTEAFIGSLERFISTNGRPAVLYSDNGTNFVGAANLFKKIDWEKVEKECRAKKIQWIFNPPTAAWWGGWWERLVRSVKDLLRKMLGRAMFNFDELRTCLSGIEATINSRPLTTVTEDPEDLIPLTPSMFTRTLLLTKFPEGEKITSQVLQKRFRVVQDLKKDLQARFRKEYLSLLVQKASERKSKPPEVGDVVLVGSDDKKRFEWPLGRIVELLPGRDSHVRTARVLVTSRNKSGPKDGVPFKTHTLIRPLQRLYPLEVRKAEAEPQLCQKLPEEEEESIPTPTVRDSQEKEVTTRSGRKVTRPRRYGQWIGQ